MHARRITDLFAVAALTITVVPLIVFPALAISAIALRESPIYTQKRVGKNGEPFNAFKIKTMHSLPDSATGEPLSDERRFCSKLVWMRKYGLDELLQIWNIARGHMSIFGPRPLIPTEIESLKNIAPKLVQIRESVPPGILSPAGLEEKSRSERIKDQEKLESDARYVEERTWRTDMKMLLIRFPAIMLNPRRQDPKAATAIATSQNSFG